MANVIRSRIGTPLVLLGLLLSLPAGRAWAQQCLGDCDGNGTASAGDLVKIIAIINYCPCAGGLIGGAATGCAQLPGGGDPQCTAADRNFNGCITAGELTGVIANMLNFPPNGCPTVATPTLSPVPPTATPTQAVTNTPVPSATPVNTPVPSATQPPPTNTSAPSATATRPPASATAGATATATATTGPGGTITPKANVCGNGIVEAANGETCDNGGTCVGGTNAGTACVDETQCIGNGVCDVGTKYGTNCASAADCGGAKCIHCKTFGGDGCAANCTAETDVPVTLVPGAAGFGGTCKANTSCARLHAGLTLPLPLSGTETMTIGEKGADGNIPFVIKASSVQLAKVPVSTVACACVRGVAASTCGGYLFESDGSPATDCTFDDTCAAAGKPPCTLVNGPGNGAAGVVGCGSSFSPVSVTTTQDQNGNVLPLPPTPNPSQTPAIVILSGSGGAGSAIEINSIRLGQVQGTCSVPVGTKKEFYGPDGQFCTDDDPDTVTARGAASTVVAVTGTATATVLNAPNVGSNFGPDSTNGKVFSCTKLTANTPSVSGSGFASAFTILAGGVPGSGTVTNLLVAQ